MSEKSDDSGNKLTVASIKGLRNAARAADTAERIVSDLAALDGRDVTMFELLTLVQRAKQALPARPKRG